MMQLSYTGPAAFEASSPPKLLVVVDTEEEFDWSKPQARENRGVGSLLANARAHQIYERYGVRPTYVIDQCVAEDAASVEFLSGLLRAGSCQVGAHLHPWVSPPYDEDLNPRNSYHGNLPIELERAKLTTLTETIEQGFGFAPRIFKAGRYGVGPNTMGLIRELGYQIDCSFLPHSDLRPGFGPSFVGLQDQPFWLDDDKQLLEVPLSKGFSGALARVFPRSLAGFFDARWSAKLYLPAVLSRAFLLDRITLTPEGIDIADQKRLVRSLIGQGLSVFSLTYHSPSLEPGHTPYVKTDADLARFLESIEQLLSFFKNDVGGEFTTLDELYLDAKARL